MTYTFEVRCSNCGVQINVEIPKGTLVKDFIEETACPNCDCRTLRKIFDSKKYSGPYPNYPNYVQPLTTPNLPSGPPIITC